MRYKAAADKREHAGAEINNKYKPDKICMHISKLCGIFYLALSAYCIKLYYDSVESVFLEEKYLSNLSITAL